MALRYNPKIITENLVLNLDPSHNKSYPTDLPVKDGLALWLDAADDSTFSYSSGTSVSQWRDKSGNNRHFFQSTAGNQPSRSAVVNSRKAIQFTAASSQYLRYNSTIINNTTGGSVFVAWRTAGETGAYSSILDNYHCGSNALGAGFQIERNISNNQYYWGFQTSNCVQAGFIPATSYSNDTTNCIWITKDSTTITGGLNGTSATPSASPSSTWIEDTKGWTIGCWGGATESFSRFYNGIHCEVIIFNRGLTTKEVKLINTYLGQKWGISNTDRSIIDLSGNSNDGLLGNGTVADMPIFDNYNKGALKLDGSSDYITVANAASLNPATVTVSIWVKRNAYQGQTANFLRRNYNDAYSIIGDYNADNVRFRIYNGSTYPQSPNATLSLNEWTNIVGTYDLSNIKIYKNGAFVGQTAHTSAISYSSSNTTMTIGRDDPITGRYMDANYGQILIYNRALSADEILQNYEAQKSKFTNSIVHQGLILNLDAGNPYSYAGSGSTIYDVSGSANNGTLNNSPTYSSDSNGILLFNGSSQYVGIANSSSLQVADTFTVSAWVKATDLSNRYGVFSTRANNTTGCWQFEVGTGSGGTGRVVLTGIGTYISESVSNVITTNTWYHITVVKVNNATQGATFYVNGSAVSNVGTAAYTISNNSDEKRIAIGTGSAQYFPGYIAQTFVYNRALSASEVLQNYNATKGRFGL